MQYTNATTTRPPSSSAVLDTTREVRFAVVMYGGVSLAVYINGVAQELYRMVRATAPVQQDKTGTGRVYRKLSHLLSHDHLLQQYRTYVEKIADYRRQLETEERDASRRKQLLEARMQALPDPLEKTLNTDEQPIRTRFIVDILSGTSAGGINAIYLAKALANDQQILPLKDLWVKEGDLAFLLNDKSSVKGLGLQYQAKPQSLLNSQRMYFKLLKSLEDMEDAHRSQPDFKSPYADELDLYITTTDIKGVPVPLRLSDAVVYERRHRNVFHFKYAQAEAIGGEQHFNDFLGTLNPFLAFAARCTSSFPFAFEPMRLCDIDDVLDLFAQYRDNDLCKSASKSWQRFFQEELDPRTGPPFEQSRFAQRPFGDGGYLDNKPFSYATETLLRRQPDVLVDRKLLYIEPSPEHVENQPTLQKPDALQNVKTALLELPTYETIREDLQRVLERNKLIERVNKISSSIERDVNTYIPAAVGDHLTGQKVAPHRLALGTGAGEQPMGTGGATPSMGTGGATPSMGTGSGAPGSERTETSGGWTDKGLADMVEYFGRYYLPYRRLRIDSVTDELAKLVTRLANFDENSAQFLAIRCLVRAWQEENYTDYKETDKSTVNGFLFDYDLSYRLRRLNFTRSQVDRIARGDPDLIEELKHHRESLVKVRQKMRQTSRDDREEWREVIKKFPQIRLQIYGEKLLPFAEQKSPQLETQLRFIKSELIEVYKQFRAKGRLLRSRQSLNPLFGLIGRIGITPQDLNDILGVSLSAGSSNGSRTITKEQRQDEEDCFKRAVAMLQRSEKSHIKANLKAIAAELRAQLRDVFALNRQKVCFRRASVKLDFPWPTVILKGTRGYGGP